MKNYTETDMLKEEICRKGNAIEHLRNSLYCLEDRVILLNKVMAFLIRDESKYGYFISDWDINRENIDIVKALNINGGSV